MSIKTVCPAWVLTLCLIGLGGRVHAEDMKVELAIYDLRELTTLTQDWSAPALDISSREDSDGRARNNTVVGNRMGAPDFAMLIQDRLLTKEFVHPATSIQESGGNLVVMNTPAVLAKVADTLRQFSADFLKRLSVQGLEIVVPEKEALRWLGKAGQSVNARDVTDLLAPERKSRLLSAPQVNLYDQQLGHALAGRRVRYLSSYFLPGAAVQPQTREYLDGMLFEVRPTLNALGNTVLLNLHYLRGVEIEEPRAVDTAHFAVGRAEETTVTEPPPVSAGEAAAGAKPAPANDQAQDKHKDDDAHKKVTVHQKFAPMLANYVRLHLPVVDQASLEIDLHLRPAMWVLAGVLRKPGKDGSRERILLFVRCDIVEESPKQF